MGVIGGPNPIVTDGLVFAVDPANKTSYVSGSSNVNDLISKTTGSLVSGVSFDSNNAGTWNFDGTDDKITIDKTLTELGISSELTIGTWFNSDNLGMYDTIINAPTTHDSWSSGFGLQIISSKCRFWINQWNNVSSFVDTDTLSYNTWYYVAATFNNSTGIKLYLNAGTPGTNTQTTLDGSDNTITIGASITSYYYDGNIAPLQIYNRELSATEILQNYNSSKDRFV